MNCCCSVCAELVSLGQTCLVAADWQNPGRQKNRLLPAKTRRCMPSKHKTLCQCWPGVGPESQTMSQHQVNIGPTSCVCWTRAFTPNSSRWTNAGLLLGQRRRRWRNSKPTLCQHLVSAVFGWVWTYCEISTQCRHNGKLYWPNLSSYPVQTQLYHARQTAVSKQLLLSAIARRSWLLCIGTIRW